MPMQFSVNLHETTLIMPFSFDSNREQGVNRQFFSIAAAKLDPNLLKAAYHNLHETMFITCLLF